MSDHGHSGHSHEKPPVGIETLFLAAIALRILLKSAPYFDIPSIEPVIPLAVLAGMYYGTNQGALVGIGGYVFSNFVIDLGRGFGFGIWSLAQGLGGAIAGYLGARATRDTYIQTVILATIAFELLINFWGAGWNISFGYFGASLPYSIVHIIGNVVFAMIFAAFYFKD